MAKGIITGWPTDEPIHDPANDTVTVGELREAGMTGIHEDIPDIAYIHRRNIHYAPASTWATQDGNTYTVRMTATFSEPFRWIDIFMLDDEIIVTPYEATIDFISG